MLEYERKAYEDLMEWKWELFSKKSVFQKLSKKAQTRINSIIPEKAHHVITEGIQQMVKMTLFGSDLTTKKPELAQASLQEKDELVKEKLTTYRRTATVEGAGTGAGGIFLGLADFPLLLSIKIKYLFEVAAIYGFDTKKYEERLFILHVFQLAFSHDRLKRETFHTIENWGEKKHEITEMDWRTFQQEYRDYIDLVKLLQLVPGFGAIVGAYANYNLLEHLGKTALHAYHLRLFKDIPLDYVKE
ncbi:EcsC family protein [Oceanobacillus kapialis]|uniref:EcsC family protein n=1 Tax=Oceanobacillus kapialis TaxID=481353 RepID=A0ABW5Q505_9BACI